MKKIFKSTVAIVLSIAMLPLSAYAATIDFDLSNAGCDFYNLITKNDYDLAPGAVESEIIINDDTGSNRNVMHVIEVDLKNPNISVMPTYMGLEEGIDFEDSSKWGSQVLTAQAEHVENDLGLNVVGGINTNLRYTSDHPYGVLVWNGVVYSDERDAKGNSTAQTYLVVDKDGNAELRSASEPLDGTEWQAVSANFGWIIKDGVNQYTKDDHNDSSRAPRTVIGIKESGELILMMNDGRQSPYSVGMSMRELAEVLLAMGCVNAVNCDGGGSSTFISEREGTGTLSMKSSPSDGGQRATLGGLLVISKAVADGKFDHATVKGEEDYVTPGSSVTFTATGADSAGGPADVPADVSWQLSDPAMGTVENGIFKSNGTVGTAVVQMVYNGNVVGEDSVNVVIPEMISFVQENITVPFDKTATLSINATVNNGLNTVKLKDGDISFVLSDAALGTVSGFSYTACSEDTGINVGTITATLVYDTNVTAVANLNLGKGSEIVWDFEDSDISTLTFGTGYASKHPKHPELGRFESGYIEVVDSATGQVKNGEKALAVVCDWSNFYAMGYNMLKLSGLNVDLTDAVRVGFWVYLTPEATGIELDFENWYEFNHGDAGSQAYPEDGWYYVSVDATKITKDTFNSLNIYHTDGYDSATSLNIPNIKTKHTIYIDDITVDYSTVVEDREAPTFSNISILKDADTYEEMKGQTVTNNTITVMAQASENTAQSNYTGLDTSSAKVFVDGIQLTSGVVCASNGTISADNINLGDGIHTFVFEIADNAGNVRSTTRQIVVDASTNGAEVEFVPHDDSLTNIPIGSMYWMDLKVANIEKIQSISTVIDLDGMNDWQLAHMEIANGFVAEYSIDEHTNDATITITRSGNCSVTGEAIIASLPIHVWEYTNHIEHPECVPGNGSGCSFLSLPSAMWSGDGQFRVAVCVNVDKGEVVFTDNATDTFSSQDYVIDTEMNKHRNIITQTEKDAKESWHIHTPVTVDDKVETCTENGYTGRTVCAGCSCGNTVDNPCDSFDGCGSVVDWGTIIPATGHTYEVVDDKLVCECGEVLNETGLVNINGNIYYLINGVILTGWQSTSDGWYYIDPTTKMAVIGEASVNGLTYTFDESGLLIKGAWVNTDGLLKYSYGPAFYTSGWQTIDGDEYFFGTMTDGGYAYTGIRSVLVNPNNPNAGTNWYVFDENGKFISNLEDGFIVENGYTYYVKDGKTYMGGLTKIDNEYYYLSTTNGKLAIDVTRWVAHDCIDESASDMVAGFYTFDTEGKMVLPEVEEEKNGIVEGYYYVNGVIQKTGLTKLDGNYYYFSTTNGKMAVDVTRWVAYDCIDESASDKEAGTYTFDAEGKMVLPEVDEEKNGIIDGYYYVNGVIQKTGLTKLDGYYYYFSTTNGKMAVSVTRGVAADCIDESASDMVEGTYTFDAEGKMVLPEVDEEENGIVDGYYYVNGIVQKTGLTKLDGNYYYFSTTNGKMAVDITRWVAYDCIDESASDMVAGFYTFDAEGKMILPEVEEEKNGIINGYYYVDGVIQKTGLTKLDGNYYYFSTTNGKMAVDVTRWVAYDCIDESASDKEAGTYTFDTEGKMVLPKVDEEKNGIIDGYYYVNGVIQKTGLTKLDGYYYYFSTTNGKMAVNVTRGVAADCIDESASDMVEGTYTFDAEGKMQI